VSGDARLGREFGQGRGARAGCRRRSGLAAALRDGGGIAGLAAALWDCSGVRSRGGAGGEERGQPCRFDLEVGVAGAALEAGNGEEAGNWAGGAAAAGCPAGNRGMRSCVRLGMARWGVRGVNSSGGFFSRAPL
jgi:hypothetical protein